MVKKNPQTIFCGAGIFLLTENLLMPFKLDHRNSIYACEAFAMLLALKYYEFQPACNIAIFSNSISVIQNLKSLGLD